MNTRIRQLLESKALTALRFSEILDVQPSGISHLLSGRNKPSYDLIEKILTVFPDVNPDWLILGNGSMYREDSKTVKTQESLFLPEEENVNNQIRSEFYDIDKSEITDVKNTGNEEYRTSMVTNVITKRQITKIIVLYSDDTYEEVSTT